MSGETDFSERLVELVEEVRAGHLDRRDFLRRAALLGLSPTVAGTLLSTLFAREASAAAPVPLRQAPPPTQGPTRQGSAGGHYQWGTVQPAEGGPGVYFWLRSPHEGSPRILTRGWPMTAYVRVEIPGVSGDIGSSIRWEGSGTLSSTAGQTTTPSFAKPGQNFVKVSVRIRDRVYASTFWFYAKDANLYARSGSLSRCPGDAHGCPACPHPVVGPLLEGSPNFFIDGRPVGRVGDRGIHTACCGPNVYTVAAGDPEILINGRPVPRLGDRTQHCGGAGQVVQV